MIQITEDRIILRGVEIDWLPRSTASERNEVINTALEHIDTVVTESERWK